MSFNLINLSSVYPGHLEAFYRRNQGLDELSYDEHYNLLLKESTEFAGSYTRAFIRLGVTAHCIFGNDRKLQNKFADENGIKTRNTDDLFFRHIKIRQPEVLWMENLNFINSDWIRKIRDEIKSIRLVVAYHCAPYSKILLDKLKSVDFVITCTPGLKSAFEREGIKTYHVYHGFDRDLLSRIDSHVGDPERDLVFSGSLFPGGSLHNDRIRMIERIISEGIGLELYVNLEKKSRIKIKQSIYSLFRILNNMGIKRLTDNIRIFDYARSPVVNYSEKLLQSNHQPLYGIEMYNLLRMSKIVLNNHVGVAGDYAGNMRLFEATGVGTCLLTDNKKNLGDLFNINDEVVVYDNAEDCIKKVKWLLANEDERKRIALSGQQRTLKSHSVNDRCKMILDIISRELRASKKPE